MVLGQKPDRAERILAGRDQMPFAPALAEVQFDNLAVGHQHRPRAFRADPEIGLAVLEKFDRLDAAQLRRGAFVENGKMNAIKTGQPIEGPDQR